MSEIRIAWCAKYDGTYSIGNWHPMKKYDNLKAWVVSENKRHPELYHWLEEKNEKGEISNNQDNDFTMIIK